MWTVTPWFRIGRTTTVACWCFGWFTLDEWMSWLWSIGEWVLFERVMSLVTDGFSGWLLCKFNFLDDDGPFFDTSFEPSWGWTCCLSWMVDFLVIWRFSLCSFCFSVESDRLVLAASGTAVFLQCTCNSMLFDGWLASSFWRCAGSSCGLCWVSKETSSEWWLFRLFDNEVEVLPLTCAVISSLLRDDHSPSDSLTWDPERLDALACSYAERNLRSQMVLSSVLAA